MKRLLLLPSVSALLLATLLVTTRLTTPAAAPSDPPKLAVLIVVDQMRADYVDRFGPDWTGGLHRLAADGAWFQQAAYPYLTTVTCAGHATISTGAFPHTHGVFQNAWWDREAGRQMTCTQDPKATALTYGGTAAHGDSAWRLEVPTFTDEMREQRRAHVVSLSLKDRSAIMLGGHGGDAVTWLTNALDGWVTSSAFSSTGVPAVKAFVDANPLDGRLRQDVGSRCCRADHYTGADDAPGEAPPPGWTRSFPHVVADATQWERSPFADAYLGRFAASLVESFHLGTHETTDVLAVSFSSPDLVGHAFGPRSHEIQDMYAHLDVTIGALFARLDELVGKGRGVVALTADHGVTPVPEQLVAEGKDAGRISGVAMAEAIERVVRPALGDGRHVAAVAGNDIYFDPGVYEKIRETPALLDSVLKALAAMPAVEHVFQSEQLRGAAAAASGDRLLRAAALSYAPGRSGDLIVALKPGWVEIAAGATHGSANPDDQRVPILFYGHGVKPGKYQQAASPADVTPTLAKIAGITMPKAEGHALACIQ